MRRTHPDSEIKTMVQISSMINSSLEITEVLNNSMRLVEDLLDAEASSIFELDHEKSELFFRLARRDPKGKTKEIRMKMGEGIVGWVASSGEPLVVPDTEKDERFTRKVDSVTGFKTKSIIALPIKNKGRTLGVLQVLNKRGENPFNNDDLEVLTIIASQIGISMDNAKLYSRIKEKFALTQSELKKAQAALLRSERLAALGQLSQGVAHEVRNPIMSIGGFAKRIKKMLPSGDSAIPYVEIILSETARLEKMVEDIEQYTSMPEPRIKEAKLSELFEEALKSWEIEHGSGNIEINVKALPEDPTVFVDKELMEEALIQLLSNAKDAMPQGGVISISTWREGTWMVVCVKDSGHGIPTNDLPRVFDPFFTGKTRGSGLGLTTVNRVVTGHGGEVTISSEPGEGTEVKIYFPASPHAE